MNVSKRFTVTPPVRFAFSIFGTHSGCCSISDWALLLLSPHSLPAHMIVATVSMTAGGESYVIRRPCCLFLYSLMPRNPRDFLLNVIHSNLGLISPARCSFMNETREESSSPPYLAASWSAHLNINLVAFFLSVSPSENTHSLSNANRAALSDICAFGMGKWLISAFHYFHFWDNHNILYKFNRYRQATFLENPTRGKCKLERK